MTEKQALYYAARTLFEQALAIDPNYADALAGDAMTYQVDYLYGWSPAGTDYEGKIIGQADRAIALAPDDAAWVLSEEHLSTHVESRERGGSGRRRRPGDQSKFLPALRRSKPSRSRARPF